MLDLNSVIPPDSGWTLNSAIRINDSGQIFCEGAWAHHEFPNANGGYGFTAACLLTPELHIPFTRPEQRIGDRYSLTASSSGVWFGPGTRPVPINPNELRNRDLWQRLPPEFAMATNSVGGSSYPTNSFTLPVRPSVGVTDRYPVTGAS